MELKFTEDWFKGETRDGFFVSEEMKRAWAAQLEVLKVLDDICTEYGLHYFAYWGTLLGAVRHQGFVPWDDDIDVAMLRPDFVRLKKIAKEVLPEGFFLNTYQTDNSLDQIIARLMNSDHVDATPEYLDRFHRCPYAVGVDIVPIDWIPDNDEDMKMQKDLIGAVEGAMMAWDDPDAGLADKRFLMNQVEDVLGAKIDEAKPVKAQYVLLYDALSAMYGPADTESLGIPLRGLYAGDQRLPKACFSKIFLQPFEVTQIPIPIGYHEILTNMYGDYTKVDKTPGHDYPFYKPQKILLQKEVMRQGGHIRDVKGLEYIEDLSPEEMGE